jgi:S1-C subfamily serine protease
MRCGLGIADSTDVGQTGANVGSTAVAAGEVTSGIVQGMNVTSGIYSKPGGLEEVRK